MFLKTKSVIVVSVKRTRNCERRERTAIKIAVTVLFLDSTNWMKDSQVSGANTASFTPECIQLCLIKTLELENRNFLNEFQDPSEHLQVNRLQYTT
jgi:hypothetical protein